jgi:hypothetical protein
MVCNYLYENSSNYYYHTFLSYPLLLFPNLYIDFGILELGYMEPLKK